MKSKKLRLSREPNLSELAVQKLTQAIVSGHFKAGERLVEMDLSELFGVSRATLREALRTLAGEGLVELRQGRGSYVAKPSIEDLTQMVALRAILEGAAARVVTQERSPSVLSNLEAIISDAELSLARGEKERFRNKIWQYHNRLMEAGGNRFFHQSWMSISNLFKIYISVLDEGRVSAPFILSNLKGFLETFRTKSPSEAEEVVRSQIIWMTFDFLDRPISQTLIGYVTYVLDERGSLQKIEPESDEIKKRSNAH